VRAVEEATAEAAKHGDHSEPLAALVAEAREMLEQARADQAERARAAAEEAEAAANEGALWLCFLAVTESERARVEAEAADAEAVKRQQLEERRAALALELQQVQAELGSGAPQPDEDDQCVVCMDAAKDRAVRPCMHVCVCETCARLLMIENAPRCPVCRGPIEHIERVFF
jgi:hypothetical protein